MPRFFREAPAARSRTAQARLSAACRRFDLSTIALRKAALDRLEGDLLVSAAVRATLARLAGSSGAAP